MSARMFLVPVDSVYRWFCVRSTCAPRNSVLQISITATNSTASTASAPPVMSFLLEVMSDSRDSVGFLQINHHGAGIQPERDGQGEIDHVAQFDHALADRSEMGEKTQARYRVDHALRRPRRKEV